MGGDQDLPTGPLPDGITIGDDGVARCWWGAGDPLYRPYHDPEWGRPVAEDRRLFEKLSLEGFQAGLSWLTILRKREHFREVFAGFNPAAVAQFGSQEVERLLADPGIVRNRAKIEATINNARRYGELAAEFGSLAAYVWQYEPDPQARPPVLDHAALLQLGHSPESTAMSKDLFITAKGDLYGAADAAPQLYKAATKASSRRLEVVAGDAHGTDLLTGPNGAKVQAMIIDFLFKHAQAP